MGAQRPKSPPRKPPPLRARVLVLNALLTVALGTLAPGLHRRLDFLNRVGPRGLAVHIALHAGLLMGMDRLMRWFAEGARTREEVEARLRKELGRPPWPEELQRAWLEARGIDPGMVERLR